jgi:hypothetical protein
VKAWGTPKEAQKLQALMLNKNWKPEVVIISMTVVQFEIKTLITVHEIYFYEKKNLRRWMNGGNIKTTIPLLESKQYFFSRSIPETNRVDVRF